MNDKIGELTEEQFREAVNEFHDLRGTWANRGASPHTNMQIVAYGIAEWAKAQSSPIAAVHQLVEQVERLLVEGQFAGETSRPRTQQS